MASLAILTSGLTSGLVSPYLSQGMPCHSLPTDDIESSSFPEPPPRSPRRALSHRSNSSLPSSKLSIEIPLSPVVDSAVELEDETDPDDVSNKMVDDGHHSDASSLCHSPSWSDYGAAEKKRKQKKKEAKLAQKELERQGKQKLKDAAHKPRRLSKAPPQTRFTLSRSTTAPVLGIPLDGRPSLPSAQTSADIKLLTVNRANTMPVSEVALAGSATGGDAFIGGLKLQQLKELSVQHEIDQHKAQSDDNRDVVPTPLQLLSSLGQSKLEHDTEGAPPRTSDSSSSHDSMAANFHTEEFDQESYASRMAREPFLAEELSQDSLQSRSGRCRSRSKRYTTVDTQRPSSRGRVAAPRSPAQFSFVASISPTEQHQNEYANFRFGSPGVYEESKDHFQVHEEDADHSETESEDDEETNYHSFVTSNYVAPELAFTQHMAENTKSEHAATISTNLQSFSAFKQKARSAFAKRPSTSYSSARPSTATSQTTTGRPSSSSSKIERMFGADAISPGTQSSTAPSPPNSLSIGSISSASLTDESEDRRSSGAQSDITTPTSSRAQSRQPLDRSRQQSLDGMHVHDIVHKVDKPAPDSVQIIKASILPATPPRMNSAVKLGRRPMPLSSQSTPVIEEQTSQISFPAELKRQASIIRETIQPNTSSTSLSKDASSTNVVSSQHGLVEYSQKSAPDPGAYLRDARRSAPRPLGTLPRPTTLPFHSQRAGSTIANNSKFPNADEKPIAKMFVVCCSCKFFHDLPSKIYEAMAKGPSVVQDKDLGVSGLIKTQVSCPWCQHGMSTECCAGYAGVVYLRERFH